MKAIIPKRVIAFCLESIMSQKVQKVQKLQSKKKIKREHIESGTRESRIPPHLIYTMYIFRDFEIEKIKRKCQECQSAKAKNKIKR